MVTDGFAQDERAVLQHDIAARRRDIDRSGRRHGFRLDLFDLQSSLARQERHQHTLVAGRHMLRDHIGAIQALGQVLGQQGRGLEPPCRRCNSHDNQIFDHLIQIQPSRSPPSFRCARFRVSHQSLRPARTSAFGLQPLAPPYILKANEFEGETQLRVAPVPFTKSKQRLRQRSAQQLTNWKNIRRVARQVWNETPQ
ncbi:hypothetical protein RB2654_15010 [Rhodobacterales bacterium HTCC2654]|uniref:Uncharacterized protein n=1 Tax=Maritimibacter alkaliphilus HTCC2654 TaxID=314271 RepID=A3VH51_9RHOB|nr:hypothetical protein RB2654_15010 [Rhodobacterales bacterium HTCC2654] [Maritimibacter alkaliphilus HTCC2654]